MTTQLIYDPEYPKGSVIGDALSGSPEFAPRGPYAIGVRTLRLTHPNQINLKTVSEASPRPLHDRELTIEVWYPAQIPEDTRQLCSYTDYIGNTGGPFLEPFDFPGRAVRDAEPCSNAEPYPVLIITHGFPGSRYLLSNLGENLATKGYIIFSIAHADTTYTDFDPEIALASAMINRTLDERFMIDALKDLNHSGFLRGLLDTSRVGMIGYSFGGYGLLRTLGVRLNEDALAQFSAYRDLLTEERACSPDRRLSAAILFAPYGAHLFDPDSLKNITLPTLWIQGREDSVVPYPPVHAMFEQTKHSDRYFLTYDLMNHKAAPNPSPLAAQKYSFSDGARRWDDWVWNQWHVNSINFHFVTAFMDALLKGESDKLSYLQVREPVGQKCVYSITDGVPNPEHTWWPGFDPNHTTLGLTLEHLPAL